MMKVFFFIFAIKIVVNLKLDLFSEENNRFLFTKLNITNKNYDLKLNFDRKEIILMKYKKKLYKDKEKYLITEGKSKTFLLKQENFKILDKKIKFNTYVFKKSKKKLNLNRFSSLGLNIKSDFLRNLKENNIINDKTLILDIGSKEIFIGENNDLNEREKYCFTNKIKNNLDWKFKIQKIFINSSLIDKKIECSIDFNKKLSITLPADKLEKILKKLKILKKCKILKNFISCKGNLLQMNYQLKFLLNNMTIEIPLSSLMNNVNDQKLKINFIQGKNIEIGYFLLKNYKIFFDFESKKIGFSLNKNSLLEKFKGKHVKIIVATFLALFLLSMIFYGFRIFYAKNQARITYKCVEYNPVKHLNKKDNSI